MEALAAALAGVARLGARPARLAVHLCSRVPSSGISTSTANRVASPTPGMLTIGGERRVQGSVDRGELALALAQTRSYLTLE
jgi:hypothetical protein